MTNLSENLVRTAAKLGDNIAIRLDDFTLTYTELEDASSRLATRLIEHGVQPGDRVALMVPNVPAYAVVYYAALRAGGVVVPMNPLFKQREVDYYLRDSGAKLIFAQPGEAELGAASAGARFYPVDPAGVTDLYDGAERLAADVERADGDTAVILYTSGTTGKPKGAELTHSNLDTNQASSAETLLHLGPDDVVMGCLPLFHVFGMTCGLNAAVANGATLTMIARFDPAKALQVIERDRVTVFEGVPTMYAAMLGAAENSPSDLSSLRTCICGGASLPVEILHRFERTFGCIILEGYGLSETAPVASFNHPDAERKAGSIGTPIRGVEMRLVDENGEPVTGPDVLGEIAIRGEGVMRGYYNKPEATAEAIRGGWFHSGDIARRDEDGYFYIVDRKKDMIIRGGYNIYPREIEEVLYEHPDVVEAAVVGIPDDLMGEEVGACVVLRAGSTATAQSISDFVKERVAAYKYPRSVWFVDALPKGATGKILKREIRSQGAAG